MKTRWSCPDCEMSSTRHWNVQRHIQKQHGGMHEPIGHDIIRYQKKTNPQNVCFPLGTQSTSFSFLTPKEKSERFSDFLEDKLLIPLRKIIEFKSLLSQVSAIQQQQPRIMSTGVYSDMQSMTFNAFESDTISNSSNLYKNSRFDDDLEIIGYRGHVCEKCLIIYTDAVYHHKDGHSANTEKKHRCNSKRLANAQLEQDKDKIITDLYRILPEMMKKTIKSWTKNSTYIIAIEISSTANVNNNFEVTATHENHWAARAIKHKQAILNNKELSDFFHKVRNTTCAFFKVLSSYQEQQGELLPRYYLIMITNNKIKHFFTPLLQNTSKTIHNNTLCSDKDQ